MGALDLVLQTILPYKVLQGRRRTRGVGPGEEPKGAGSTVLMRQGKYLTQGEAGDTAGLVGLLDPSVNLNRSSAREPASHGTRNGQVVLAVLTA